MEPLPFDSIVIIDTVDLYDVGVLVVGKTKEIIDKADLAVLLFSDSDNDIENEKVWFQNLIYKTIPIIGIYF